jgi:hypothetical protein
MQQKASVRPNRFFPGKSGGFIKNYSLDAHRGAIVGKTNFLFSDQILDCRTVNVWPAILIVPVRVIVGFTVTRNVTVPFPLSDSELSTFNQLRVLLAE